MAGQPQLFSPEAVTPILSQQQLEGQQNALDQQRQTLATGALANQGAQMTLDDRNALYGLAAGLQARDPAAYARAVTLGQGGQNAISTLSTADSQTAASKLALLNYQNGLITPGVPMGGGAGGPASGAGSTLPSGFTGALGAAEGGSNPRAVNAQGYSGQFQFGAARLADPSLGLYQPAAGENVGANQWRGTFSIPGFPDVKTHADFLANPDAQKAAFGLHIADIDRAIAATPGGADMNQNGLRAVAHLGGVGGMQRFVATGGQYNPADANGTRLSDYYQRFGAGGVPALQASFGHPDGPHGPLGHGVPAPAAPVMVASTSATAGMPATANDASGTAPPSPVAAPDAAQSVLAQLRAARPDMAQPGATAPDQIGGGLPPADERFPPAPVASAGAPGLTPAPATSPMPMPGAAPAAPAAGGAQAPFTAPSGPPPGTVFYHQGTKPFVTEGMPAGRALAQIPDGKGGYVTAPARMPGVPAPVEISTIGTTRYYIDGDTKQTLHTEQVPNTGRLTAVPQPDGGTRLVAPTGETVGGTGPNSRDVQKLDYERDAKDVDGLATASNGAQQNQVRIQSMRDMLDRINTGAGGSARAQIAAFFETVAPNATPSWVKNLTGMSDAAAAQEFNKYAITSAGQQEQGVLGARGGVQAIKLFQSANPSLDLLGTTNRAILGTQLIAQQANLDYAKGALDHQTRNADGFRGGQPYTPLANYDRDWLAQRNPQVYAAAMGALAGAPVSDGKVNGRDAKGWATGLSDQEYQRALQIVSAADPRATVNARSGPLSMQPNNGAQAPAAPQQGAQAPAASDTPFMVQTPSDYTSLRSGALYRAPDGHTRRKP